MECMGLHRPAIPDNGADMSSLYDHLFRAVCSRHPAKRLSAPLSVRRREAAFSCSVTYRCTVFADCRQAFSEQGGKRVLPPVCLSQEIRLPDKKNRHSRRILTDRRKTRIENRKNSCRLLPCQIHFPGQSSIQNGTLRRPRCFLCAENTGRR